ncbi:hypothetical protein LCGC14_1734460 [marine sediment metagenome]|uniref:Uncharacterized protein n=1 Tax=marine sediment metagenome TaxID=412755 RepID=A0A0F9K862_9ZZZZ
MVALIVVFGGITLFIAVIMSIIGLADARSMKERILAGTRTLISLFLLTGAACLPWMYVYPSVSQENGSLKISLATRHNLTPQHVVSLSEYVTREEYLLHCQLRKIEKLKVNVPQNVMDRLTKLETDIQAKINVYVTRRAESKLQEVVREVVSGK